MSYKTISGGRDWEGLLAEVLTALEKSSRTPSFSQLNATTPADGDRWWLLLDKFPKQADFCSEFKKSAALWRKNDKGFTESGNVIQNKRYLNTNIKKNNESLSYATRLESIKQQQVSKEPTRDKLSSPKFRPPSAPYSVCLLTPRSIQFLMMFWGKYQVMLNLPYTVWLLQRYNEHLKTEWH